MTVHAHHGSIAARFLRGVGTNLTEEEGTEYEREKMALQDARGSLSLAERRGVERGLEKGEQIGLQKGEKIGLQKGEQIGLQKGRLEGLQKGEQIGLERGRLEGLRAAVLGANDGIVSTASLVVGVAAAQSPSSDILVAGVAGLLFLGVGVVGKYPSTDG